MLYALDQLRRRALGSIQGSPSIDVVQMPPEVQTFVSGWKVEAAARGEPMEVFPIARMSSSRCYAPSWRARYLTSVWHWEWGCRKLSANGRLSVGRVVTEAYPDTEDISIYY